MKKHRMGAKIILGIFIVFICLSCLRWILLRNLDKQDNNENREMATMPKLSIKTWRTYPADFTAYFNDTMPFRNKLIALNNELDYFVFKKSSNKQVIAGKEHWLFYTGENDEDTIADYQGTNLLSEKDLKKTAENCTRQRDYVSSLGKEFVIFIAPNKERMYHEFMPAQYGDPSETYRALQIYSYLKDHTDLRVVYPYDDLIKAKETLSENIYYKTDTHWNAIGGYVGAAELLEELGIDMPAVDDPKLRIKGIDETAGDLADMLGLGERLRTYDREYEVTGYDRHHCKKIKWSFRKMGHFRAVGADPRTIYMLRDSFATHMAPYIGSQFKESFLRNRATYTFQDLIKRNPDVVVYEVVERRVGSLKDFSIQ